MSKIMASGKDVLLGYKKGRIARNILFSPEQKQQIKMIIESPEIAHRDKSMHLQMLVTENAINPINMLINGFRNMYAKIKGL